jgi:hypothetical protein
MHGSTDFLEVLVIIMTVYEMDFTILVRRVHSLASEANNTLHPKY